MTTAIQTSMTTFPFLHDSEAPYYRQIYDGYRDAILTGRLRPGERLPSTRALAAELGISRLPVVNAFEQLLHEGYVEGRAGSGTYVKDTIPDHLSGGQTILSVPSPGIRRTGRIACPPPRLGPLRVSLPALDRFPLRLWSRLVARHAKQLTVEQMAYG